MTTKVIGTVTIHGLGKAWEAEQVKLTGKVAEDGETVILEVVPIGATVAKPSEEKYFPA